MVVVEIVGAVVAGGADLHPAKVEAEVLGAGRRAIGGPRAEHDLADRPAVLSLSKEPDEGAAERRAGGLVGGAGGGLVGEVHARGVMWGGRALMRGAGVHRVWQSAGV